MKETSEEGLNRGILRTISNKGIKKTLEDIFNGVSNYLEPNMYIEEVRNKRFAICKGCPILLVQDGVEGASKYRCDSSKGGCGCELEYKWRVLDESCPKGKWGPVKSK